MIRTVFISLEYAHLADGGGIGTYVYHMAHALSRADYAVSVFSVSYGRETIRMLDGSVEVFLLPMRGRFGSLLNFLYNHRSTFPKLWKHYTCWLLIKRSFAVWREVRKFMKSTPVDIIEYPDCGGEGFFLTLFRPKGPKLVVKLHTPSGIVHELNKSKPTLLQRLGEWMEKRAIQGADGIVSPSQGLAEMCRPKMALGDRPIAVIPNPVNTQIFFPAASPEKPPAPMVLYVGRLEKRKGVEILIETVPKVLERFPNATFLLIGADTMTGPGERSMEGYLKSRLSEFSRKGVQFLGQKSQQELLSYYQRAAVCVFPSLYENFPYTCLEAMACGTAVIGSKAGGMAEMIEDGISGMLVDVTRPGELERMICRLLGDKALAARLGENAVKRVRTTYHRDVIAKRMMMFHQDLIQ